MKNKYDLLIRFMTPDVYTIIKYDDRYHIYLSDDNSFDGMSDVYFGFYLKSVKNYLSKDFKEVFHQIMENNVSFTIYLNNHE